MENAQSSGRRPAAVVPVLLVTGLYLVAAIIGAVTTGNREFIFYIVILVSLVGVLMALHRKRPLTTGQLWCLNLWGLAHMAGGLMAVPQSWPIDGPPRVLYNLWLVPDFLKFDQLVHAYGFGVTTWLCWHLLRDSLRSPGGGPVAPTFGILTVCVATGMGFGALNEVIEFTATLFIANTNVGDYENTGWDLVFNFLGSVLAALVLRVACRDDYRKWKENIRQSSLAR